ncbi:MAG: AraC family transcriptional regulator [Candidatus Limiplasma sp.]|nr:AraC family transcriptional regulator [Candidatus Limiplasma sp.]MEA5144867.1 AraC family transcriptional regulator [Candidatus Limiplasma sp.]
MEWLERMNDALDYLEQHLEAEIDLAQAARLAACSQFHFQRVFSYMAGVPLGEYIRRRRMTLAALELTSGGAKVLDLALKYGYESPTAFNRAFQSVHGIPPSQAKQPGIVLTAFPRISFTLSVKGDTAMNYRIENRDAFRIVGMKLMLPMDVEASFQRVPLFWQENAHRVPELLAVMDGAPAGVMGVSTCMNTQEAGYYIAVASSAPAPAGMESYDVPAATWAIFDCVGAMPHALQTLQRRIITEWLPTSGYEYDNAPDIEVYTAGDQLSPSYQCQAWLPIVKKQQGVR